MVRRQFPTKHPKLTFKPNAYTRTNGESGEWTLVQFGTLFSGAILASVEEVKAKDVVVFTDVVITRMKDEALRNSKMCVALMADELEFMEDYIAIEVALSEKEFATAHLKKSSQSSEGTRKANPFARTIQVVSAPPQETT
jgi:hypothetical protein